MGTRRTAAAVSVSTQSLKQEKRECCVLQDNSFQRSDKEDRIITKPLHTKASSSDSLPVEPSSAWKLLSSSSLYFISNQNWLQLPNGGITELTGAAGSGKTQLALQFAKSTAASGASVLYLTMGGNLSLTTIAKRLQQMNATQLDRIWLRQVWNDEQLLQLLQEPQSSISLLVLDSLTDLFRGHAVGYHDQSSRIFQIAALLKRCSSTVLVLNQVTTTLGQEQPALGLSWAQCINSSYWVARRPNQPRSLTLRRSSRYPTHAFQLNFLIEREGIRLVEHDNPQDTT